jgi:hypothetical protein
MQAEKNETEGIKTLLQEFSGLLKQIKSAGKENEWIKYDQAVSGRIVFRVADEIFGKIYRIYGISLPEEIRFFYQSIGSYDDYGQYLHNRSGKDQFCKLAFQYSEEFAAALITEYKNLDKWGKIKVSKTIESYDQKSKRFLFPTDLQYLLLGDDNFFDLSSNQFKIPILQKVYELSGRDSESFRIVFVDNPGEYGAGTGIIVNTSKAGFKAECFDDCGRKIVVNRVEYQYCSNVSENSEQHYLVQYRERIEIALKNIRNFAGTKL